MCFKSVQLQPTKIDRRYLIPKMACDIIVCMATAWSTESRDWWGIPIRQTFEDRRHKVISLTRLLSIGGGEVSIVADYYSHDANIAALNVSKKNDGLRMKRTVWK